MAGGGPRIPTPSSLKAVGDVTTNAWLRPRGSQARPPASSLNGGSSPRQNCISPSMHTVMSLLLILGTPRTSRHTNLDEMRRALDAIDWEDDL
jgi:hypothetical protein